MRNVVDIPCSVLGNKRTKFIQEVKKKAGVIEDKVLDECAKSNSCVHIEINQ